MTAVGFEPTPLRTGALSQRLRPLGQTVLGIARLAAASRAFLRATLCWGVQAYSFWFPLKRGVMMWRGRAGQALLALQAWWRFGATLGRRALFAP